MQYYISRNKVKCLPIQDDDKGPMIVMTTLSVKVPEFLQVTCCACVVNIWYIIGRHCFHIYHIALHANTPHILSHIMDKFYPFDKVGGHSNFMFFVSNSNL